MTENDSPANITGISTDRLPNLEAAMDLSVVGNGRPNLFDSLIQRVHDWTRPSSPVDDSDLLPPLDARFQPEVLLMAPDEHGAPSVVGSVIFTHSRIILPF